MNVQAALDAARFTVHPQRGCNVVIESRVASRRARQATSCSICFKSSANTQAIWDAAKPSFMILQRRELRRL